MTRIMAVILLISLVFGVCWSAASSSGFQRLSFASVSGTGISVIANLGVGSNPFTAIYDPGNGYVYATNSGSATVSVISGTSVIANLSVGNDPSAAIYDPGNGYIYVVNSGSFTVSGTVSVISGGPSSNVTISSTINTTVPPAPTTTTASNVSSAITQQQAQQPDYTIYGIITVVIIITAAVAYYSLSTKGRQKKQNQ